MRSFQGVTINEVLCLDSDVLYGAVVTTFFLNMYIFYTTRFLMVKITLKTKIHSQRYVRQIFTTCHMNSWVNVPLKIFIPICVQKSVTKIIRFYEIYWLLNNDLIFVFKWQTVEEGAVQITLLTNKNEMCQKLYSGYVLYFDSWRIF